MHDAVIARRKGPLANWLFILMGASPSAPATSLAPGRTVDRPSRPIVGVGCSAGGLEALGKFFTSVPADTRLAFVVIQHLSPAHPSALPELLGRFTRLPVVEAEEGMRVWPGRVHVIPPGRDLSITGGVLHLAAQASGHGMRMPVDVFLCALASDSRQEAVGVILSGMGSDGLLGLAAIKLQGGLTLVQDPASAEADGMPGGAIKAGMADIVVEPQDMPACIIGRLAHAAGGRPGAAPAGLPGPSSLDEINLVLREHCGSDFSLYKTSTLLRRIERRMMVRQVVRIEDYVQLLRREPQEPALLFQEMLIGVTSFFRDPAVWDELRDAVLPALLARHPTGKAFRAWVPACSTGEEAYSLAMVFAEAASRLGPNRAFSLQIFATDLDAEAVDVARKGLYGPDILQAVSPERLARFFSAEASGHYRIRKDIRETVVFATQNIAVDPPFTRLDVLTCRNLLIYFEPKLQKQLLPLFHYALNPGGLLVLGSAETTGNFAHLFTPVNLRLRIHCRDTQARTSSHLSFTQRQIPLTTPTMPPSPDPTDTLGALTDQLIQQTWAPAAVLVNADGDILYISGRTGKYLEPAVGKANINIHAMAREGLREPLAGVIHRALATRQPVSLRGLRVGTNGGTQIVNVLVHALDKPEPLQGKVILVFEDVAKSVRRRRAGGVPADGPPSALQEELQQTREALQATHEAMQTTVEELRSSNEELQSTNEELQSTNEELTTSKEELQSVNEELQTVNAELQSKVEDLTWVKNDMANLLNSTEIATVFLDGQLKVRRFTTHALKLFRLIDGDIGRPLAHVVTDLDYPGLSADAGEVLATLVFKEAVSATSDGRWYRVRVMPYRTQDNLIDGVVITFTDITAIKTLEARLRLPPS